MGFFDDIGDTVNRTINSFTGGGGSNLGNSGGGIFGDTGDAFSRYMGYNLGPQFVNDYYGSQTKQDEAEKDAKRAQRAANNARLYQEDIANYQSTIAGHFKNNKSKYQGLLQDAATKPLRADMSRKLADNKLGASRRGLLGSGIEQRGGADIINRYRTQYAEGMDQGAADYDNILNEALQTPLDTGFSLSQLEGQAQNSAFEDALARIRNRNQSAAAVGQAGGTVAGRYLGSR